MNIKVNRIRTTDETGKMKAFIDLIFEGTIIIKGFKIIDGENGLFVSYPSEKGKKEGEFFPTIKVMDTETRQQINDVAVKAYNENIKN